MATLKLKKPPARTSGRPPVRGTAPRGRPTLAQAQAERAERAERPPRPERSERPERAGRSDRPPRTETSRPERPARRSDAPSPPDSRSAPPRAPRADARRQPPRPGPQSGPHPEARATPGRPPRRPGPEPAAGRPAPRPAPRPPARPAPRHAAEPREPAEHLPGSMRLSKRMSELGMASRREADEWIEKGWVRVDSQVVAQLGARVLPGQRITIDAKARHQQAQRVTVLINKPVGFVSGQAEDGYQPAVVLVTPENQWREDHSGIRFLRSHLQQLAPAGRLDIDSVGLLVLTQDGRIARQLIGEDSVIEKEYLVRVEGGASLSEDGLKRLNHGLELDGEALQPARVEWVNADQLRFVLTEGKKRQIRRMCEAVGLTVTGLKRVRIGNVMLGDLPPGQWRYLRLDEGFA